MRLSRLLPLFVFLAFWPVWRWYVLRMTDGSDEPWGLVALVIGGTFLWRVRIELRLTTAGIIAASILLLIYAVSFASMPALIRAILALLIIATLGGTLLRHLPIWGLFALSLPIIASLQFYLGYPLRIITAASSQWTLNLFGFGIERKATQLLWEGQTIGVDAPCSGIQMLWVGMLLTLSLCAAKQLSWKPTLLCSVAGFLMIVLGNAIRATLLFIKESGMVRLPDWSHTGIGLVVFALLVWSLIKLVERMPASNSLQSSTPAFVAPRWGHLVPIAFLGIGLLPFLSSTSVSETSSGDFPGWPRMWNEHYLEPLPLTEQEAAFAKQFPGQIAVFSAGPNKIIYRWVSRPTRKLHSSADCLRAAGWSIHSEKPGSFLAQSNELRFSVEETISNSQQSWKEVSAWFWAATLRKTSGPWWAVTVIQPTR
ncbi:MAG: archaeosortase/exosortase family protein [Verrucomicrobiota bacterium]